MTVGPRRAGIREFGELVERAVDLDRATAPR
jgi:hypothetical protein